MQTKYNGDNGSESVDLKNVHNFGYNAKLQFGNLISKKYFFS